MVVGYHEARLADLLEHVREGFKEYDTGSIDAFELDDIIHHGHDCTSVRELRVAIGHRKPVYGRTRRGRFGQALRSGRDRGMSFSIRTARPADRAAILKVVHAAFTDDRHDGTAEVEIVRATWRLEAAPSELDLVAVDRGEVIGHVLGARGRLREREAIGLAPLAVAPPRQREGIGSALVQELITRAEAQGWPLVVVLGAPEYYVRFGFEPSARLGISYGPVGQEDDHFQVRRLRNYDSTLHGEFIYCWEV